MKRIVFALGCLALAWLPANAGTVAVFGDRFTLGTISGFYQSQGQTASVIPSLTDANVAGVNLLWLVQPGSAYTPGQITTMQNYLSGGGRIAFMGEHGTFAPTENNNISAAIAALGGTISIINDLIDPGVHDATIANGQILANPLTAGVSTYNYAAFAELNLTGSAVALMKGSDLTTVMMAYQVVGGGSIFLITDQNVWDDVAQTGSNNNAIMFMNLLQATVVDGPAPGPVPDSPVPEPSTVILISGGLGAMLLGLRKRSRK